jgi:hypothetical protein
MTTNNSIGVNPVLLELTPDLPRILFNFIL